MISLQVNFHQPMVQCMFFQNNSVVSIICREKKLSRLSAIKVLDHAMTGNEGGDNCQKFVDILGLRINDHQNGQESRVIFKSLRHLSIFCREKKLSRLSAIKVLDHAMTGNEGGDNCQKFVDILGLRSVFPLFMKTPKKHKKVGTNSDEMEGNVFNSRITLN